jgi:hypothetical protein
MDDWIGKIKLSLLFNIFLVVIDSTDGAKGKFVTGQVTYPGGLASPLALKYIFQIILDINGN